MKLKLVQIATTNLVSIYIFLCVLWHSALLLCSFPLILNSAYSLRALRLCGLTYLCHTLPRSRKGTQRYAELKLGHHPPQTVRLTLQTAHSYSSIALSHRYFTPSAGLAQLVERLIRN